MDPSYHYRSGDLFEFIGRFATPSPVPVIVPVPACESALQNCLSPPPSCNPDLPVRQRKLFLQALLDNMLTKMAFQNPNISASGVLEEGWRIKVGLDE